MQNARHLERMIIIIAGLHVILTAESKAGYLRARVVLFNLIFSSDPNLITAY